MLFRALCNRVVVVALRLRRCGRPSQSVGSSDGGTVVRRRGSGTPHSTCEIRRHCCARQLSSTLLVVSLFGARRRKPPLWHRNRLPD
jgi:hypothetical protein